MASDPQNALSEIFDILTLGSPMKSKPVRDAIKAAGGFLVTTGEPQAVGFGTSLIGLARVFELHAKQKAKKRRRND